MNEKNNTINNEKNSENKKNQKTGLIKSFSKAKAKINKQKILPNKAEFLFYLFSNFFSM